MGYMFATSPCGACKNMMSYNPHSVPSFRFNGTDREPVCKDCMAAANAAREKQGFEPHPILADAYEPTEE